MEDGRPDGQRRAGGRAAIDGARASLGIELGSTRIKACLVGDDPAIVLATGSHEWENRYVDGRWTYAMEDVRSGLRAAYRDLADAVRDRYGVPIRRLAAIGVSAMMHGYLAFDGAGRLLVPFRTWRNTSTGPAADALTDALGVNVPLRWSVAHLYQAVLDEEPHVGDVRLLTTLAGAVHQRLGGDAALGIGDASGVFPIDPRSRDWDDDRIRRFDGLAGDRLPVASIRDLLPTVLVAGGSAGTLTEEGARYLDPTGELAAGALLCPPEGDAGTGMVATNAVRPREANVSIGTSVFAMAVLERPLDRVHREIDVVTTPAGDPVAMVHCNNGASELAAWVGLFRRFADVAGTGLDADRVFEVLFREALSGAADGGGLLAYNTVAGEPVTDLAEGRPLFVRTPDSRFDLATFMRAQLYGVFGALSIGMRVLAEEGVGLDRVLAHGGLLRTEGVAQRFLAGALDVPVAVGDEAGEGGPWGMAVLAAYAAQESRPDLATYLDDVFASRTISTVDPDPDDARRYGEFLARYRSGLAIERAAITAM